MVAYIVQLKKKKNFDHKSIKHLADELHKKEITFYWGPIMCQALYICSLIKFHSPLTCMHFIMPVSCKKKKNGEKKGKTRSKIFPAKSHSKRIWTQSSRAPKSSPSKVLQARTSATIFKAPRTWYIPLYFKYSVPQTFKTLKNYQEMQAFQNAKPTTQTMICLQK